MRVTTASNVAAVMTGELDSVDLALSRIGATRDEVQTASITALPNAVVTAGLIILITTLAR